MKVSELAGKLCDLVCDLDSDTDIVGEMDIVVRGEDVVADIAYVTVDHDHGDNTAFLAIDLENEHSQSSKVKAYQMPLLEEGIKIEKIAIPPNTLTCVYCGMAYPEGTPPSGAQILTDHIKVCEKHPMKQVKEANRKLRSALSGLVGADTKEELAEMEIAIRVMPAPEADKVASINAIHALLNTID